MCDTLYCVVKMLRNIQYHTSQPCMLKILLTIRFNSMLTIIRLTTEFINGLIKIKQI